MFLPLGWTASDLLALLKNLKQTSSTEFQKTSGSVFWQKKFYDHILREKDNFNAVASYIWMNPVRAGLCEDPRDYPYSGSFVCDWKKMIVPLDSWVPEWKRVQRRRCSVTAAGGDWEPS